jgi:hypothetical protein
MGEDDEASGEVRRSGGEEGLEVLVNVGSGHDTSADLPVAGVELLVLVLSPDDGAETHLEGDVADAVVDVTVRRAHGLLSGKKAGREKAKKEWKGGKKLGQLCHRCSTPACHLQPHSRLNKGGKTHVGGNAGDIVNNLLRPSQLSHNLLVRERRQARVRPSVDRELMAHHVLGLNHLGTGDGAGTDDEEGRFEVLLVEEVEEAGRVRRGSVVCECTGS